MFAVTVNANIKEKRTKVLGIAIVAILVLFVAFLFLSMRVGTPPESVEIDGHGEINTVVESDEEAKEFAKQFSYEIGDLYSLQEMYVPIEFNDKYIGYNELQKEQGFDLEPYKGEKCKLYIYELEGYELDGLPAYMSVIVYRERVIGGHVSSLKDGGEYHTFFID
ncbi:MAG: DUF4830 domain-containing protein [Ruminococcus sp.]|nr:DUF4830 domain-containing protein [Ruminococcus sp.]